MALFALDHNYPAPIIEQAKPYLSDVELVFIGEIDTRLPEFEDWELLLALHHHRRDWDGIISNDTSMLDQERELAVLGYTHLTLVADSRGPRSNPFNRFGFGPHRGHCLPHKLPTASSMALAWKNRRRTSPRSVPQKARKERGARPA